MGYFVFGRDRKFFVFHLSLKSIVVPKQKKPPYYLKQDNMVA